MTDLPVPAAARLPRPRWADPRFALGLVLVLASVVAGSRVVAAADDTVAVWAAGHDLAVGAPVAADDLVVAHVHLDGREASYLGARAQTTGLVTTRPLLRGELVAATAVGRTPPRTVRAVSVETEPAALGGIDDDSVVDVYVVVKQEESAAAPARLVPVLRSVPVLAVGDEGGRFSSGDAASVTLEVPEGAVGAFLAAVSQGTVHLVEVPARVVGP